MDKLKALISLNDAKQAIDNMIEKVKAGSEEKETDTRKLLIILLSVLGALVVIGIIAYAVYKHFSSDYMDDYDDIDDIMDEADDEDDEPEVLVSHDDVDD